MRSSVSVARCAWEKGPCRVVWTRGQETPSCQIAAPPTPCESVRQWYRPCRNPGDLRRCHLVTEDRRSELPWVRGRNGEAATPYPRKQPAFQTPARRGCVNVSVAALVRSVPLVVWTREKHSRPQARPRKRAREEEGAARRGRTICVDVLPVTEERSCERHLRLLRDRPRVEPEHRPRLEVAHGLTSVEEAARAAIPKAALGML